MNKVNIKPLEDFPDYYINDKGQIFKYDKNGNIKEVKSFKDDKNSMRVNLKRFDGKTTTKQLHTLVYKAFRGEQQTTRGLYNRLENSLVFIDGDNSNCSLDNLITVDELRLFYLDNRKEV